MFFRDICRPGSVIVDFRVASVNSAITTDDLETVIQNSLENSCHLTNGSGDTTFQLNDGCIYGEFHSRRKLTSLNFSIVKV